MPNGTIGPILSSEAFLTTYSPLSLEVEGESYYFGKGGAPYYNKGNWITRKLLEGGTISSLDMNASSSTNVFFHSSSQFACNVNGTQYVLEQDRRYGNVICWSFSDGTKTVKKEMKTNWENIYETLGTINVNGIQYFYGQSSSENHFFYPKISQR